MNVEPGHELAPVDQSPSFDLTTITPDQLAKLNEAKPLPVDLVSDYWSPVNKGEKKNVIFDRISPWPVVDQNTGEVIELECVFMHVAEEGSIRTIRNGSKRLVAAFRGNNVRQGTGWEVTYEGKTRNRTNSFSSDDWKVRPLDLSTIH